MTNQVLVGTVTADALVPQHKAINFRNGDS